MVFAEPNRPRIVPPAPILRLP